MITPEAIRDLVKQARELERDGVAGPDWRSGQRFYHGKSEPVAIALMPKLATALEQLIEAVEEAERVIGPFAALVRPRDTDHYGGMTANLSMRDLRAAAEWQRKHGRRER